MSSSRDNGAQKPFDQKEGDSTVKYKKPAYDAVGDQADNALLRSRIDEQGQLICFLKQRADEHLMRNKVLEEINSELELLRNQANDEIKELKHTCAMLEKRFNELAENHQEMIKFKDVYKSKNAQLELENKQLKADNKRLFSAAIEEREAEILSLLSKVKRSQENLQNCEVSKKQMQEGLSSKIAALTEKVKMLEGKLSESDGELQKSENEIRRLIAESKARSSKENGVVSDLLKEKESLLSEVMQRGKLLQEKQVEHEALKSEVNRVKSLMKSKEDDFSRREDRVNADMRVRKLQEEKDFAENELHKLQLEFKAFRVHTNQIITDEKDLNSKLRNNLLTS